MIRFALRAGAALALAGMALAAAAQDYPTKPISVIVPFAAGGPTDTVARLIAQSMSQTLKQTVLVENYGGAGGTIGADRVAKAKPDGYTLLLHHIGHTTAPALYRKLPYDTINDFEPIGLITDVPMTIVSKKDFAPKDMKELIAYVKTNKDKVTYANAGVGSASHLCGMLFMSAIQDRSHDRSVQGHGPGDERHPGRAGGLHVRPDDQHDGADQGGQDQGVCSDHAQARGVAAGPADNAGVRTADRSRLPSGTACTRPRARPSR